MGVVGKATSNVDELLKEAEKHLIAVDEKLRGLVEKHTCQVFSPEGLREVVDPFTALASSIMGQQVCHFIFALCEMCPFVRVQGQVFGLLLEALR